MRTSKLSDIFNSRTGRRKSDVGSIVTFALVSLLLISTVAVVSILSLLFVRELAIKEKLNQILRVAEGKIGLWINEPTSAAYSAELGRLIAEAAATRIPGGSGGGGVISALHLNYGKGTKAWFAFLPPGECATLDNGKILCNSHMCSLPAVPRARERSLCYACSTSNPTARPRMFNCNSIPSGWKSCGGDGEEGDQDARSIRPGASARYFSTQFCAQPTSSDLYLAKVEEFPTEVAAVVETSLFGGLFKVERKVMVQGYPRVLSQQLVAAQVPPPVCGVWVPANACPVSPPCGNPALTYPIPISWTCSTPALGCRNPSNPGGLCGPAPGGSLNCPYQLCVTHSCVNSSCPPAHTGSLQMCHRYENGVDVGVAPNANCNSGAGCPNTCRPIVVTYNCVSNSCPPNTTGSSSECHRYEDGVDRGVTGNGNCNGGAGCPVSCSCPEWQAGACPVINTCPAGQTQTGTENYNYAIPWTCPGGSCRPLGGTAAQCGSASPGGTLTCTRPTCSASECLYDITVNTNTALGVVVGAAVTSAAESSCLAASLGRSCEWLLASETAARPRINCTATACRVLRDEGCYRAAPAGRGCSARDRANDPGLDYCCRKFRTSELAEAYDYYLNRGCNACADCSAGMCEGFGGGGATFSCLGTIMGCSLSSVEQSCQGRGDCCETERTFGPFRIDGSGNCLPYSGSTVGFLRGPDCEINAGSRPGTPISLLMGIKSIDGIQPTTVKMKLSKRYPLDFYEWYGSSASPLLVYDPQQSGKVTSAEQLFGNLTFGGKRLPDGSVEEWQTGYHALATLDVDNDGLLTGKELKVLGLWYDQNRDGVSQKGEVLTLEKAQITKLYVNANRADDKHRAVYAEPGYERTVDGKVEIGSSVDWRAAAYKEVVNETSSHWRARVLREGEVLGAPLVVSKEVTGKKAEFSSDASKMSGVWEYTVIGWPGKTKPTGELILEIDGTTKYVRGISKYKSYSYSPTAELLVSHTMATLNGNVVGNELGESIQFKLHSEKDAPTFTVAQLSADGKKLVGTSTTTVKDNGGVDVVVEYDWVASRRQVK